MVEQSDGGGTTVNGWIPYRLKKQDNKLQCFWLNTFDKTFNEPFFDETILKLLTLQTLPPPNSKTSSLAEMQVWAPQQQYISPTVIIFHVSRCGSTLISQLLATADKNIVLAEVPFFDDVLRLPYKDSNFDKTEAVDLFAAAVKHYGQIRTGNEKHLIIKTDSWHIFFDKQIRALYPNVPFVLMYRSPDEVLKSNKKQVGMQMVPNLIEPQIFGFKPDEILNIHGDEYTAKVLEKFLTRYHHIIETDDNTLLVNYIEGPMPVLKKIAAFAKIDLSTNELAVMEERSGYHSKRPGEAFSEKLSKEIPECLTMAMELYQSLEAKRLAKL